MNGYLLATAIVVFFLRNTKNIAEHLALLSPNDIFVSEVTVAELEYGNRCSGRYEDNKWMVDRFCVNS